MKYEWDTARSRSNFVKHGSDFSDAGSVFAGPCATFRDDRFVTGAVGLLVRMCFCESPLRKLLAYVHDKNAASCRVLWKLGFTQEGVLREHYIINGVPENELVLGLLKQEWRP